MKQKDVIQQERRQRAANLISHLQACTPTVLANYPLILAYLYGSVAQGKLLPKSDIDIAILFTEAMRPYERLQLELAIQADLEDTCTLKNVDVRSINQAPIMVRGPIVQEGVLLYSRDEQRRIAYEVLTRKLYFDYRPTAERMQTGLSGSSA